MNDTMVFSKTILILVENIIIFEKSKIARTFLINCIPIIEHLPLTV